MTDRWFKVTVREIREGKFLVRAPEGADEAAVQIGLDDAGLVLGDNVLEGFDGVLATGHFEPISEIKVTKLPRRPTRKQAKDYVDRIRMKPDVKGDPDAELVPVVR